jgi:hypothetical protein
MLLGAHIMSHLRCFWNHMWPISWCLSPPRPSQGAWAGRCSACARIARSSTTRQQITHHPAATTQPTLEVRNRLSYSYLLICRPSYRFITMIDRQLSSHTFNFVYLFCENCVHRLILTEMSILFCSSVGSFRWSFCSFSSPVWACWRIWLPGPGR